MTTIVFQGDSITDAGWQSAADGFGDGYVKIVADWLSSNKKDFTCYNRGISGNRAPDLVARWDNDTISLQPDILTLLIGINDVNHKFVLGTPTSAEAFEADLHTIIQPLASRGVKIIMMQPFVVRKNLFNHSPEWEELFQGLSAAMEKVASKHNCVLIRTGEIFDAHVKQNPDIGYALDGIHPDEEGKKLLADLLIAELDKLI